MGKFALKTGKDGQFYFNLKADNGQIILSSEGYTTKAACDNGIESVRKNAADESRFDKQTSGNGKFYFNLKAGNSQVIGKSQMYESEAGCDNGIRSVQSNAPDAGVVEE
jgi:hypothetical protein